VIVHYVVILVGLVIALIQYIGSRPRALGAPPPWPASATPAPPTGAV
jgi:hypothetical protein